MIVLERTYHADRTTGVLHAYHGVQMPTLELPWKNNRRQVSCIPEGRYHLDRDSTGRHRWFRVRDSEVAPRSAIEIHPASQTSHLLGCIGLKRKDCNTLLGMMPAGDMLWIRSDSGPPEG